MSAVLPDDVIVVAQVEPLAVLSGVVDHAHSGHEVHQLLGAGVVQVIAALMAPVAVHPLESEAAAGGAAVRHAHSSASPASSQNGLAKLLRQINASNV